VKNKLTVTIGGQEYTLVAAEDPEYMKKVAEHVDGKVNEMLAGAKVTATDALVLAALNMADEYFKGREAEEKLRAQLKQYVEEATDLKLELSKAKQEIFKLQNAGRR